MIRKVLTSRICTRRLPPPCPFTAGLLCKTFSAAPSKKPLPASKPSKAAGVEPEFRDPPKNVDVPSSTAPQKSSSINVIVGLAIVAAAGGLTWLSWEGQAPFKLKLPENLQKKPLPDAGFRGNQQEEMAGRTLDEASTQRQWIPEETHLREAEDTEIESSIFEGDGEQSQDTFQEGAKSVDDVLQVTEEKLEDAAAPSAAEILNDTSHHDGIVDGSYNSEESEMGLDSSLENPARVPESFEVLTRTLLSNVVQVLAGEAHEESHTFMEKERVFDSFVENKKEDSSESHADGGDHVEVAEGEANVKDAVESGRVGLPDESSSNHQADGGKRFTIVEGLSDASVLQNVLESNVGSSGEVGDGVDEAPVQAGAVNGLGAASILNGEFSKEYLIQKGHEAIARTYLNEGEGTKRDPTLHDQSRELEDTSLNKDSSMAKDEVDLQQVEPDVLVGAIYAAVQKQAEIDTREFNKNLQKLREEHAGELKDANAKELMYAEEADRLQKDLKREQRKGEERVRLLQQISDERLKSELKRKDEEIKSALEEAHNFAKLQAKASVAEERAAHLQELNDVKLQVNALHTAFYTRSEEARKSHTAHKLSMGAFAFENAMRTGAPVMEEAILLIASAGGPGADPLLDAAIASIPGEAFQEGTKTPAQLHEKFTRMKGPLRELVLIPATGGGVLTHLLARLVANIKVSEQSPYLGDEGIESVIGLVETYLAEEKLAEAAELLQMQARGTKAEELAAEWARLARNRAIMDQTLQLIQSHAVAIASSLA